MSHHLSREATKAHQRSCTGTYLSSLSVIFRASRVPLTRRCLFDSFRLFAERCTQFPLLQDCWLPEPPKPRAVPPPSCRWCPPCEPARSVPPRRSRKRPRTGWTSWRLCWRPTELLPIPLAWSSEEGRRPSTEITAIAQILFCIFRWSWCYRRCVNSAYPMLNKHEAKEWCKEECKCDERSQ